MCGKDFEPRWGAIVGGGVLLSWQPVEARLSAGALLIVGACLAWAVDNNLTRKVSANDAMLVACLKGLLAGACNTALAMAFGAQLPAAEALAASLLVGFLGYGLSLSLFVVGLRTLGTARTGAYFSVAPLFGVLISFALWPQAPSLLFWAAAALMAVGVWLHISERHEHEHEHEPLEQSHRHRHDARRIARVRGSRCRRRIAGGYALRARTERRPAGSDHCHRSGNGRLQRSR